MRYILDTDWIINLLAGKKDAEERIQSLNPEEIVVSLITVAEIYESAYNFANPEAHIQTFRSFLKNFQLLNLNLPIIEKFAEVRAHLRRKGRAEDYMGIGSEIEPSSSVTRRLLFSIWLSNEKLQSSQSKTKGTIDPTVVPK